MVVAPFSQLIPYIRRSYVSFRARGRRGGFDAAGALAFCSGRPVVTYTAAMLIVLLVSYLLMLALVKFAQRIIDRPQVARRRSQPEETPKPVASS